MSKVITISDELYEQMQSQAKARGLTVEVYLEQLQNETRLWELVPWKEARNCWEELLAGKVSVRRSQVLVRGGLLFQLAGETCKRLSAAPGARTGAIRRNAHAHARRAGCGRLGREDPV